MSAAVAEAPARRRAPTGLALLLLAYLISIVAYALGGLGRSG